MCEIVFIIYYLFTIYHLLYIYYLFVFVVHSIVFVVHLSRIERVPVLAKRDLTYC